MDKETYDKERTSYIEGEHASADQHDKAMLTLSAGALALSLTFLEKIVSNPTPDARWMVLLAWLCFVVSIVFTLTSFHCSQKAYRIAREILDEQYTAALKEETAAERRNKWADYTSRANLASFFVFIGGAVLLILFAWTNFPTGDVNGEKDPSSTERPSEHHTEPTNWRRSSTAEAAVCSRQTTFFTKEMRYRCQRVAT